MCNAVSLRFYYDCTHTIQNTTIELANYWLQLISSFTGSIIIVCNIVVRSLITSTTVYLREVVVGYETSMQLPEYYFEIANWFSITVFDIII